MTETMTRRLVAELLSVLILLFGPVSAAHLNPVVSAADWLLGRRAGLGIALAAYLFPGIAAVADHVVIPTPSPVRPGARHAQYQ